MSDVHDDERRPEPSLPPGDDLPPRISALLSDRETWAVPPAGLEADVLVALRRERNADAATPASSPPQAAPAVRDELASARERRASRRAWSGRRLLAVAVATAAVAVGTLIVTAADHTQTTVVALAPTALAPEASGRAELRDTASGFAIELDLDRLAPAPRGAYYQAWLKNRAGDLVTIGTFHARDGSEDIMLWSGVNPQDYPTITVTVQREGDGPKTSGDIVLRGTLR